MESISTRRIVRIGVTAALYVALTLALSFLSYGMVQFRIAEALMLLCLFGKDYVFALTVGCFVSNIFSSVGVIDTVVGTAATLLAGVCIYLLRNRLNYLTASAFPVLFNMVFVGLELYIVLNEPLLLSMIGVAVGEIVCVTIVGAILMKAFSKNKAFMNMLCSDKDIIGKP